MGISIADITGKGLVLPLFGKKPFIQVRIVISEKAFFCSNPDIATKKKSYLVKGNEALVYEVKEGWLKVVYGKTTGWIQEDDMAPFK